MKTLRIVMLRRNASTRVWQGASLSHTHTDTLSPRLTASTRTTAGVGGVRHRDVLPTAAADPLAHAGVQLAAGGRGARGGGGGGVRGGGVGASRGCSTRART
jgi:hypothetical protein